MGRIQEHSLAGFERAAEDALAEDGISDALRAGLILGAGFRHGWRREEVLVWLSRNVQ